MRTLSNTGTIRKKDRRLLRELKETVQALLPSAQLLLYGSVARGEADAQSDYDILVLTHRRLSTGRQDSVRDAILDLELSNDVVISTIFYTKTQWATPLACAMPFHKYVEQDSVLL